MANEILFYSQVGAVISYVITVFFLYRLLVSQKDATIELLREKNDLLKTQLEELKEKSPETLEKRLAERVKRLQEEIGRLGKDEEENKKIIKKKEEELKDKQDKLSKVRQQLQEMKEVAEEYFCPNCEAPLLRREFHYETVEYGKYAIDVDHECIEYECGRTIMDGETTNGCSIPLKGNPQITFWSGNSENEINQLSNVLKEQELISSFEVLRKERSGNMKKICVSLRENNDEYPEFGDLKETALKQNIKISKYRNVY